MGQTHAIGRKNKIGKNQEAQPMRMVSAQVPPRKFLNSKKVLPRRQGLSGGDFFTTELHLDPNFCSVNTPSTIPKFLVPGTFPRELKTLLSYELGFWQGQKQASKEQEDIKEDNDISWYHKPTVPHLLHGWLYLWSDPLTCLPCCWIGILRAQKLYIHFGKR